MFKREAFEQIARFDWVIAGLHGISETEAGTLIVDGTGMQAAFVTFIHCFGEHLN